MWSLRWVLLGLGALVVVGIYLWGRGALRRPRPGEHRHDRVEPTVLTEPEVEPLPDAFEPPGELEFETVAAAEEPEAAAPPEASAAESAAAEEPVAAPETERVVTIRLVPKRTPLNGQTVVLAMRAAGLRHGRYGIFHRMPESGEGEPLFSVANLTEPGSFDLTNLAESTLPGMSFFILLPGIGDPVERFDMMVDTARSLARELDAELHDDRGSTWSVQRERYVREQIIEYRYQLERSGAGNEA